jgi:predicted nucleotidyltransferase
MTEPNYILRGIAGSHAHGLATEKSDEDLHGVFGWPTAAFWNLESPRDSITGHEPQDHSYHEIQKYLKLALKGNPTVLELLYLEDYSEKEPGWGQNLIQIRHTLLGEKAIRAAYVGYADSQFQKMQRQPATDEYRIWKFAKHLFRLLEQADSALRDGEIRIKVADRNWYLDDLRNMSQEQVATEFAKRVTELHNIENTPLPEWADPFWASEYLHDYRKSH